MNDVVVYCAIALLKTVKKKRTKNIEEMNNSVMVSQIENSSIFELDINVIEQITVRKKKVSSISE